MAKTCYEIHPDDEMRLCLRALGRDEDLLFGEYMRTGFGTRVQIREILRHLGRRLQDTGALLDFAAGFGRIVRFLLHDLPPERLTVADVNAEAVAFQRDRFGVRGIVSETDPEAVDLGGPYDLITCISLFTHLPDALFRLWLARLSRELTPQGLLLLTTQPPTRLARAISLLRLLPDSLFFNCVEGLRAVLDSRGHLIPKGHSPELRRLAHSHGYTYFPKSESRSLDSSVYGSTFVARRYVERVVREELNDLRILAYLPRSLNSLQDIWVIGAASEAEVPAFDLTLPSVSLDAAFREQDLVRFGGWGLSTTDNKPAVAVRAYMNDELVCEIQTEIERPDVAELYGEGVLRCGFEGSFAWQGAMAGGVLAVEVEDSRGLATRAFHRLPP